MQSLDYILQGSSHLHERHFYRLFVVLRKGGILNCVKVALAAIALAPVREATGASAAESVVDSTIVLKVGQVDISQYALEKNFRRAFQAAHDSGLAALSTKEGKSWLTHFLAQQIIVAQALADGYRERLEVSNMVAAMERYMLSKPDGPFYQLLYAECVPTKERLRIIYDRVRQMPDAIVLRLPNAEFMRLAPTDWNLLENSARLEFLRRAQMIPGATIHDGPLPWPYRPMEQLEETIAATAAGSWVLDRDEITTSVVYIRSISTANLPPFEASLASLKQSASDREEEIFREKRRAKKLGDLAFKINPDTCARIVASLNALDRAMRDIPFEALAPAADASLASYLENNEGTNITVSMWIDYYNRLFIRRLPDSLASLEESLASMLMEKVDCQEARRLGVDQTSRFVEDRRNFLNYQALDLFEKERLLPAIEISSEEIEAFYRKHSADYEQVTRAMCLLLRFETEKHANDWVSRHEKFTDSNTSLVGLEMLDTYEISRDQPIPMLPDLSASLLFSPDGSSFGPFSTPNGYVVVQKQSSTREQLPLALVADDVRTKVIREKLNEVELRLAREWCQRFTVEDNIPYSAWGLNDWRGSPWMSR